ncbi:MAG: CRTAC1 family protein [Candidatus Eisenbacteria bacterium]
MKIPAARDARWGFAALLTLYALSGSLALGFNRTPLQILVVVGASCALDLLFARLLGRNESELPLSAYITGLSLSLLVNYAHGTWLPLLPVLLAVASKHLVRWDGRHVYNPSLFGLAVSLMVAGHSISPAPAYQWGGSWLVPSFFVLSAASLFLFRVRRGWLVGSFLFFYVLQTALRAWVMRWHLPPETLFLGTLGSPPFYLFAFYMITDPKTSPDGRGAQIGTAAALTAIDLWLHTRESLYTFYYAAFMLASTRLLVSVVRAAIARRMPLPSMPRVGLATLVAVIAALLVSPSIGRTRPREVDFRLVEQMPSDTGIDARLGKTLEEVDPRVAHVAKWVLSVGASVAAADVDLDGRVDLFLVGPLMEPGDRAVLYRNLGGFRFERLPLPALETVTHDPRAHGLIAGATFADFDDDGDPDLFLPVAFGGCHLLANRMVESGAPRFEDVTGALGEHAISLAAQVLDYDRDGKLDLFVAQAMSPYLADYADPTPLNLFALPSPAYPGDRRMFHFMHESWWNAQNGGRNCLYRGAGDFTFTSCDSLAPPETHWSLAVGSADFDHDGWTDLYVANDFGPDDLYRNREGRAFDAVRGRFSSAVGRDTYKGMNATVADVDRDGALDVYVSNVHEPLQAEGSLLWMNRSTRGHLRFRDEAARRGVLNERRFGWGAAAGDLDNDGWIDLLQANGMVDDTPDKRYPRCPDYWYVNEKVMRAGPEIHAYADRWGDLRGRGIFGREADRVYLNRGASARPQFIDVANEVGWTARGSSRGIALIDLDDDGHLDVVVTHPFARPSIYRNATSEDARSPARHWVGLTLIGDGTRTARDAIGSRVTVTTGEGPDPMALVSEVQALNGFSAQGDRRLHFGLGSNLGPLMVTVEWTGGLRERFHLSSVDQYYTLREGSGERDLANQLGIRRPALRSP